MSISEKQCSRCKEIKPTTEFSRDKQHFTGYKSACKICAKKDWDKWRLQNLEKQREKDRVSHYIRTYNLDEETAKRLVKNRIGCCQICGEIKPLVVDHCHTTHIVRGFICSACNSLLGYSKDNINTLREAIKYLEDFYG